MIDFADFARKLERERNKEKSDSDSYFARVLELREALERIALIELCDSGDPWSSLEQIGAIAHNAIHHPQNVNVMAPLG